MTVLPTGTATVTEMARVVEEVVFAAVPMDEGVPIARSNLGSSRSTMAGTWVRRRRESSSIDRPQPPRRLRTEGRCTTWMDIGDSLHGFGVRPRSQDRGPRRWLGA